MPYYTFQPAVDTKETGHEYPQIQKWKSGYNDDKPDSYYSYSRAAKSGNFPDFEPDLDSMVMHGRAKPTDLVSSFVSRGFIITEKLKLLFEKFHFPPHRFYPAKVIHKKVLLEGYFLMDIISDYSDFVDYPKSSFITCGFSEHDNPMAITLTSKKDYVEKSDKLKDDYFIHKRPYRSIMSESIQLNAQFDQTLDGFKIGLFNIDFYISQSLRDSLIENNITGCDIHPTDRIVI